MCLREKYMAEHELVQYPKDPIFIIIDEYAQIELMPGKGAEMLAQDDILALLVRIGTRSRSANIKLIVQTQNPRAVQEDLKSNLMSRALLKTSKANDMPLTLKNEDLAYEMGFNHVDFDQGRYIFEDYNDGDDKMTELQFPYIDASKKYHEKYKGTATTEVDDKFDKYKQEVVDDYPYLAETKLLSGVEPVEAEDDKKPAPEMPVSAPQTFDFNSYLSKDDSVDESSDEEDNDMEREEAEINAMKDEAMQILNEIIGDE
jgi:DNA segregation ATPase FtsK/SpoIIIE-like protein